MGRGMGRAREGEGGAGSMCCVCVLLHPITALDWGTHCSITLPALPSTSRPLSALGFTGCLTCNDCTTTWQ